ncbi:MAG: hypothetical protein MPJ50_03250 [Pirellulales bacterium]|nr:hypothetical protein [Pirellulales bacterium]
MSWIGLDIGGAQTKLSNGSQLAISRSFPLWRRPDALADLLQELLDGQIPDASLAVTMTGELADCYRTKREGVDRILKSVESAAAGRDISVYLTDGTFVSPDEARDRHLQAAAANWHALAKYCTRLTENSSALLIDIGSTTADIIPLDAGGPCPDGLTDPNRLASGELVYTGVRRSPVCAVTNTLPWKGKQCGVAQELFATTWDAYLVLDELPEEPDAATTADGRPATKDAAHDRLARCICADREMFDVDDALAAAQAIEKAQLAKLGLAAVGVMRGLSQPPRTIILSGSGEFLARKLVAKLRLKDVQVISLAEQFDNAEISRSATALAVAVLAEEAAE